MHDCIFQWMNNDILPPGMRAVRCRCHEDTYATKFPIDAAHRCPVSGQTATEPGDAGR